MREPSAAKVPLKEKLYIEVLATVVGELGVFVQDAGLGQGPFPERLDRLGDMSEAWLGSNPTAARLLIWEILGQGAFVQSPAGQAVPMTVREVSRFLAEGMASGDIPKQNPDHLAMSVISIHLMYFAVSALSNDVFETDIFSDAAMQARMVSVREQIRRLCGVALDA